LEIKAKSAVTCTIAAGAAGTIKTFTTGNTNIRNADGTNVGTPNDTSLVFTGGVATREVTEDYFNTTSKPNTILGDYWVNYGSGLVTVCKATTGTSETAAYTIVLTENSIEDIDVTVTTAGTATITTPTTFNAASKAITSTATLILASNANRKSIVITNEGANAVRIGGSGVTYNGTVGTDGIFLPVGAAITIENTGALYAICATALTATLSYFESNT